MSLNTVLSDIYRITKFWLLSTPLTGGDRV